MKKRKSTWELIRLDIESLSILEITDSKLHKVNSQDLFLNFLARLQAEDKYYSVSQFFSPSQAQYDQYDQMLMELRKRYPLNLAITSNFDTTQKINSSEEDHAIHVLTRNLDDPLSTIVHFSGTTLSNIIYDYREGYDGWLEKITRWNKIFLDFFWLKIDFNSLIDLVNLSGLLLWTADGHITLVARNPTEFDHYLRLLHNAAETYSLDLELRFGNYT